MGVEFARNAPINHGALLLSRSFFSRRPRILILGAGGWFGKTALALAGDVPTDMLLIGRKERILRVNKRDFHIKEWSDSIVGDFGPEIVLDFAFLTRGVLDTVGHSEFLRVNTMLADRLLSLASSTSVRKILTVSSGAALSAIGRPDNYIEGDPYGFLKYRLEKDLRRVAAQSGTSIVVARAWSVSGGFVGPSESLAFSAFIRAALWNQRIDIHADSLVYRRYSAIEDFVAVSLWGLANASFEEIDSGGERIEMLELAKEIATQVGGTKIRELVNHREALGESAYVSDNLTWSRYSGEAGLVPLTISQQVENVIIALRESHGVQT